MLQTLTTVTAEEMSRLENLAYSEGASEEEFMERAAAALAECTLHFLQEHHLEKKVSLLAGKGNNGGDGFATASLLLDRGISVTAWHIYPASTCSPLCQKMRQRFEKKGGVVRTGKELSGFEGVILDALVGTGFKGRAERELARAIESAHHSGLPILAIDIPSGLNGTTGAVESVAIQATETFFVELPKIGFFLQQGWDHVGRLMRASFGLDKKYKAQAKASAHLFDSASLKTLLPPIKRTRHKYQAGYVLAFAGSKQMPGAALLASYSALLSGAGVVRLFHPPHMEAALANAPYELLKEEWAGKSLTRPLEEAQRAQAMLIGPGMGRTPQAKHRVRQLLSTLSLPAVLDADALFFLAHNPKWALPKQSILTPHRGEMQLLLSTFSSKSADPIQNFVDKKQIILVLKGAPTFIYQPHDAPLIVIQGDPGMATAGSGDVLTGIIAGLLAQGLDPKIAACIAVCLHGLAGEIAAKHLTSYCVTASALLDFLSEAFAQNGRA